MYQANSQAPHSRPSRPRTAPLVILAIFVGLLLLTLGFLVGLLIGFSELYKGDDSEKGGFVLSDQRPEINADLPEDLSEEQLEYLEEIYDHLRERYDGELEQGDVLDSLKKGLVEATGDPHSQYHTWDEKQELYDSLRGHLIGIGAELGLDDQERVIIVTPFRGSPAERAGLRSRDIILAVDDQSVVGWTAHETASLIRGDAGTAVMLTIQRLDSNHEHAADHLEIEIIREEIDIPSVAYEIEDGIGILTISQFQFDEEEGKQTVELAVEAAREMRRANVRGVILDLRYNSGGSLDATGGIGGLWLKDGQPVVYLGIVGGELEPLPATSEKPPLLAGLPLVILMNAGSASASEIIIGALRDNDIGRLVGETTYGKDSVQTLIDLDDGGLLRLTTNHWYTPERDSVKDGIVPEIEIEDDPDTDVDEQMEKALELLR